LSFDLPDVLCLHHHGRSSLFLLRRIGENDRLLRWTLIFILIFSRFIRLRNIVGCVVSLICLVWYLYHLDLVSVDPILEIIAFLVLWGFQLLIDAPVVLKLDLSTQVWCWLLDLFTI
jgi:hypothetical protein